MGGKKTDERKGIETKQREKTQNQRLIKMVEETHKTGSDGNTRSTPRS